MAVDAITMKFAKKIADEEWADFRKRHVDAIRTRTVNRTGTLLRSRDYSVKEKSAQEVQMNLTHPDYERFIDMKKKFLGKRGGKGIFKNRDVLFRKPGIPIHNRIIWGKLNPISFRLMHELVGLVVDEHEKIFGNRLKRVRM
jgi:hypothetical protein